MTAPFDDPAGAATLARGCAVVTYEIERIGAAAARAAASEAPLRPGPGPLETIQDRAAQKRWLLARGYPVGAFLEVESPAQAAEAVRQLGPVRLKRARGGHDGRGQGRGATPQQAVHPIAQNFHEHGALVRSVMPAPIDRRLSSQAKDVALQLASDLSIEGLLAVELFVDQRDRLLVNELSPRPHNTFHHASAACATGQFEQLVRAICDLPLGSTAADRAAALYNLTGSLWSGGEPDLKAALALPGVSLHLYGRRPGRAARSDTSSPARTMPTAPWSSADGPSTP